MCRFLRVLSRSCEALTGAACCKWLLSSPSGLSVVSAAGTGSVSLGDDVELSISTLVSSIVLAYCSDHLPAAPDIDADAEQSTVGTGSRYCHV